MIVTSHPEKVALLWGEFKKRLGDSIQIKITLFWNSSMAQGTFSVSTMLLLL
jgi:hypothetical protein